MMMMRPDETPHQQSARLLLYTAHLLKQFSDASFLFSIAVFLASCTFGGSPMRLVSLYGFTTNLAVILSNASLGAHIDRGERWATARQLILYEKGSVLGTIVAAFLLLQFETVDQPVDEASSSPSPSSPSSTAFDLRQLGAIVAVYACGALAHCLYQALLVAVERDWIVTMALGDEAWLSSTTVALKQIDLGCRISAPPVMGVILANVPLQYSCVAVAGLTILSLFTELACIRQIYRLVPALATKTGAGKAVATIIDHDVSTPASPGLGSSSAAVQSRSVRHYVLTYVQQTTFPAGLGLAFIYANPLTFGNGILTTYLLNRGGMSLHTIGLLRGLAAGMGLLGTFAFRLSDWYVSMEATGMWSIVLELTGLGVPLLSFYLMPDRDFVVVLLLGIMLSRIGVIVFDIVVTRLQQQHVPEPVRGLVGGVQQSLNATFALVAFTLPVVVPHYFISFLAVACSCVTVATCLFAFGIYLPQRRHHDDSVPIVVNMA
jgi:solute carrier family 40 (iron-regulated transporter), member 1